MENNHPCLSSSFFKDYYTEPVTSSKPLNPFKVLKPFKEPKPEPVTEPTPETTLNSELLELKIMVQELKDLIDRRN